MAKRSAKRMVAVVVILAVLAAVGVILWLVLSPKAEDSPSARDELLAALMRGVRPPRLR